MINYYVLYNSRWHKAKRFDYDGVILSTKDGHIIYNIDSDLVKIK